MSKCILHFCHVVLGASADESHKNLISWLDRAASRHLPAGAKETYADDSVTKGVLHYVGRTML